MLPDVVTDNEGVRANREVRLELASSELAPPCLARQRGHDRDRSDLPMERVACIFTVFAD